MIIPGTPRAGKCLACMNGAGAKRQLSRKRQMILKLVYARHRPHPVLTPFKNYLSLKSLKINHLPSKDSGLDHAQEQGHDRENLLLRVDHVIEAHRARQWEETTHYLLTSPKEVRVRHGARLHVLVNPLSVGVPHPRKMLFKALAITWVIVVPVDKLRPQIKAIK